MASLFSSSESLVTRPSDLGETPEQVKPANDVAATVDDTRGNTLVSASNIVPLTQNGNTTEEVDGPEPESIGGIEIDKAFWGKEFNSLSDDLFAQINFVTGKREEPLNKGILKPLYRFSIWIYRMISNLPNDGDLPDGRYSHNKIGEYLQKHANHAIPLAEDVDIFTKFDFRRSMRRLFSKDIKSKPHLLVQILLGVPSTIGYGIAALLGRDIYNMYTRELITTYGSPHLIMQELSRASVYDDMGDRLKGKEQGVVDTQAIIKRTPLIIMQEWDAAKVTLRAYSDIEERKKAAEMIYVDFAFKVGGVVGALAAPFGVGASAWSIAQAGFTSKMLAEFGKYLGTIVGGGLVGGFAGSAIGYGTITGKKGMGTHNTFFDPNKTVPIQEIMKAKWEESLKDAGLTPTAGQAEQGKEETPDLLQLGTAASVQRTLDGTLIDSPDEGSAKVVSLADLRRQRAESLVQHEDSKTEETKAAA